MSSHTDIAQAWAAWLAALAGASGFVLSVIAIKKSGRGIKLAEEANEISRKLILEEFTGRFIVNNKPNHNKDLHKWEAEVIIQNTGGRALQLCDLEFEFQNGLMISYRNDFADQTYCRTELPVMVAAQESATVWFFPIGCFKGFFNDTDQFNELIGLDAIDYKNAKHPMGSDVCKAINAMMKEFIELACPGKLVL